ncbi:c-type cytochrome [Sagittula sp. NFXS13]|uniref:hypothetical protein n=1 Tax=Sagittula sp. NFXS13 TaxID=2819095 RepID=UPI0032DE3BC4
MTIWMKRGALLAGVAMLAGCGLFRAQPEAPVTLSGTGPAPAALTMVAPQRTVVPDLIAPTGLNFAGGRNYAHWCSDCHGAQGRGDGPLAVMTAERPADLTRLARGNGGVFPARYVSTRMNMTPGPYHRGIAPSFAMAMDGPLVEWAEPGAAGHLTTSRMADLLSYLQALQG